MADAMGAISKTGVGERAAREDTPTRTNRLRLNPLNSSDRSELWDVVLEPEVLTLSKPDGAPVLQLHREEAARYVRFAYDVFQERTLSFVIIDGLKSYSFRCRRSHVADLLSWLPQKPPEEVAKEVHMSALAVCLFGALHVILVESVFTAVGALLLTAGVIGIARPLKSQYTLNGVLMLVAGLWDLFSRVIMGADPRALPTMQQAVPLAVGGILILWGIQQLSMLEPNRQLRAAREVRDRSAAFLPGESHLVRRIGRWHFIGASLFALHALIVLVADHLLSPGQAVSGRFGPLSGLPIDTIAFGCLALVAAASGFGCRLRKRPAYAEAKVATQLLIATAMLLAWGVVLNLRFSAPVAIFGGIFPGDLTVFTHVGVWASMIPAVLLFNRWFTAAVDQELEEQRE